MRWMGKQNDFAISCLAAAAVVVACADSKPAPPPSAMSAPSAQNASVVPAPVEQKPTPAKPAANEPPPVDGYEVVSVYPHDPRCYTQGLVFDAGRFIESQGQYGESSLRLVELETGNVLVKRPLEARYFGEGCAVLGGLVYQLTWQQKTVFVYDARELRPVGTFPIEGEGWGVTTDGASLFVSDGTDTLRVIDPKTFAVTRKLPIRLGGRALYQVNELEWIEGEIWANVWHSEHIVRIDPKTGAVVRVLDLTGILPATERRDRESVLNGIAYDAAKKRIFVTGKNWPKLFEIRVKAR